MRSVKVAFASCTADLIPAFLEKFSTVAPELDLFVVSEFPPPRGRWIPFRPDRPWSDNASRCKSALRGYSVRFSAVILQPKSPYKTLLLLGCSLAPLRTLIYNANLDHFMIRPRALPLMVRHLLWRVREQVQFQTHPGGDLYSWAWRFRHPRQLRRPLAYAAGRVAGRLAARSKNTLRKVVPLGESLPQGVSVVIPSRNGKHLLERVLPLIPDADETIIVDNGSDDGTPEFLALVWPHIRVEHNPDPLSFASAVNRGIRAAKFSHVCLLNNDMLPEPGFLPHLKEAFDQVPDLFCATAQIFFPPGKRREETGKAVMRPLARHRTTTEFPIHCIEPLAGEDLSWVLYGSGGCSLYDTGKLRALGGFGEIYEPAYVEDLDVGLRAWQQGWPTVFVAGARTVHDHRTTTSRYYKPEELDFVLERNYLRFLAESVSSPEWFRKLWDDALVRLNLKAALEHHQASKLALEQGWKALRWAKQGIVTGEQESRIFAVGSGNVAVFPGRAPRSSRTVLIASCYIPFPLSHGGAVRIYNLMKRGARYTSQVLITFVDELGTPPDELLDICTEVVEVRRLGSHVRSGNLLPDVVEDFHSPAFEAALQLAIRKWQPDIVQLEFTQMAQYAELCRPAKTLLVEHDITIDLYRQLLEVKEDYDLRQQLGRWSAYETKAWEEVDCVVTMSEQDRRSVRGARRVETLPNGVDLARFQPSAEAPEGNRLLFIGSFAHIPNLLALDFFFREVWPLLAPHRPFLHIIAGQRHEYFYDLSRDRISFPLHQPDVEIQGFVGDVRPAYQQAAIVIAPLLASAGTNIKITEAMAMGKAIVSTPAGVNGLHELQPGRDFLCAEDGASFASAIAGLFEDEESRRTLERNARQTAERVYNWDAIAEKQRELYESLIRA